MFVSYGFFSRKKQNGFRLNSSCHATKPHGQSKGCAVPNQHAFA
jgi:hypothetical protein